MLFCPTCSNLLLVETTLDKFTRWYCQSCPYVCTVKQKMYYDVELKKKKADDVMGANAWNNSETIETKCPKCNADKAYFQMFQTRSADEPMTQFFKCCTCGFQWKEG